VRLIAPYLEGEHGSDQPGRYLGWLQRHEPVYGWVFDESWHDIGNYEQLLEADNRLRDKAGLPVRDAYLPD
jgi:NDP-sugar pyrophosphorylase family protein